MVLIVVARCECGHSILDHVQIEIKGKKIEYCQKCNCEEFRKVEENKKDLKKARKNHKKLLKKTSIH